jgi:hypothetical protein
LIEKPNDQHQDKTSSAAGAVTYDHYEHLRYRPAGIMAFAWSKFTPFEIAVTTHMVMPAPVTAKAAIVHTIHVQRLNVGCLSGFSACVGACTTSEAETRDHLFLRQLRQHRVQQLKRW